jgi:peptidoglycan/xylan/chitin deacetylase (PgdA/CDA1 family)
MAMCADPGSERIGLVSCKGPGPIDLPPGITALIAGSGMDQFSQSLPTRFAKLVVAIVFYAITKLSRAAKRILGRQPRPICVGVFYHQVPPRHRERFARQMDHLLRWSKPVRADQDRLSDGASRCAFVAVDDGWLSFVENGLPEMKRRGIPVTIFVVAGRLGDSLGESNDRLITEAELRDLSCELVTIGSHTTTHARLTSLDDTDVMSELHESRTTLERILQREVRLFCFPFGAYRDAHLQQCYAAGYARVFASTPVFESSSPSGFVVGRIRADPTDWLIEFRLKLCGAYQWMAIVMALKARFQPRLSRALPGARNSTRIPASSVDSIVAPVADFGRHLK